MRVQLDGGQPIVSVPLEQLPQEVGAYGMGRRGGAALKRVGGMANAAAEVVSSLAAPAAIPLVRSAKALGQQENRVAVRDFFDGLMGNAKGGDKAPVAAKSPFGPVDQALAQGRASGPVTEMAPADRQSQLIAAILGSGLTVKEAATVAGIMPANAATKAPTAKDMVMGQAAQLSAALYSGQMQQAAELAKTDPAGAKALELQATEARFSREAGLVGFNPLQLAQAQLMGEAE